MSHFLYYSYVIQCENEGIDPLSYSYWFNHIYLVENTG